MKVRLKRAAFVGRTYRQAGDVVEVAIAKRKLPDWMEPVNEGSRKWGGSNKQGPGRKQDPEGGKQDPEGGKQDPEGGKQDPEGGDKDAGGGDAAGPKE